MTLCIALTGWTAASAQPVFTFSAPTLITTDPATHLDPAISGDIVVYTDLRKGNEDICYFNLANGTETLITSSIQISTSSANQRLHDVSGSRIVYTDLGSPGPHINLYDILTSVTSSLTAGHSDQNPRTDGDKFHDTFSGRSMFFHDLGPAP